ncbi:zinc ribbon domain-containing protein [Dehalogenimonas sp. THU2]|uniref:zinc ribbon domain-containing protein n=1 Tax=Dehalogenimonas sp. THU2 TaxID=3151121 RepID=UPI003218D4E8
MNASDMGDTKITCARCHTSIDTAASSVPTKFCPNCGNKLETPPAANPRSRASFCPSCGKGLSAPFDYCPSCGVPLSGPQESIRMEMPEETPPTPAEIAAAKKAPAAIASSAPGEERQIITDPKLKKLYKQWAAHSDLPEEAMPVMERPRPVPTPTPTYKAARSGFDRSSFLTDIPPIYLFIAGTIIVGLLLILAIIIAL